MVDEFRDSPFQDLDGGQEESSSFIDSGSSKGVVEKSEKAFLKKIGKKNKKFLINLDTVEKERVARYIYERYEGAKEAHQNICDKIDEHDKTFRMEPAPIVGGSDLPRYRTPISMVTVEVIHAHLMNVIFTPKDIIRVLPTEPNDMEKVNKISTFANWSASFELDLFKQLDRLFHYSTKSGESPYMVSWVKVYGVEIKHKEKVDNDGKAIYDPDTKEVVYEEVKTPKLLYNAPKLEIIPRKDYIQPVNATMDKLPDWEMRKVRLTYDDIYRMELEGKVYSGTCNKITGWSNSASDTGLEDYEGMNVPLGQWTKEFVEFYGRLRVNAVKSKDNLDDEDLYEELEDEFIGLMEIEDQVLCQVRENRFPLKMRPIGMDYFIPDDSGRRSGLGVIEFLKEAQRAYDALWNQYIFGTVQSNSPAGFSDPFGNMRDEKVHISAGYITPVSNAASLKFLQIPAPNQSMSTMLELIQQWVQLMFGISDYASGIESRIDPSAPGKKAELVVAQGNVRLNMLLKRKVKTIEDIMKRWFLLYQANMPPNKFMRIVGDSEDEKWKFENVNLSDFELNSIPDFTITGNVLSTNKSLELNKAVAIYNMLVQNPFFSPQTVQGLRALHELTKWLIDKTDEMGLNNFLPKMPGTMVHTPEEENARFLQGEEGDPLEQEDHMDHIMKHRPMLVDPNTPDDVKKVVVNHINKHVEMLQKLITQQIVVNQLKGGMTGNEQSSGYQGGQGDAAAFPGAGAGVGQGFQQGSQGRESIPQAETANAGGVF